MTGIYRFADKIIQINSLYDEVHEYCRDYRCDGIPDLTVVTSHADIEYERQKSEKNDISEGHTVRKWSDSYLEELAVYRKIAEKMPAYDTFLFHGSAIAVSGQAYLFTAKSGTGKSTHTRLWRELLGSRAVMVNDDKPLIRVGKSGVMIFGTPYNGKHHLGENISVPLKNICILERSQQNHIRRISKAKAYPMLLQQVYRPADSAALAKTLTLIDKMTGYVTLWRLGCNMELSAAELAYHTMKGI